MPSLGKKHSVQEYYIFYLFFKEMLRKYASEKTLVNNEVQLGQAVKKSTQQKSKNSPVKDTCTYSTSQLLILTKRDHVKWVECGYIHKNVVVTLWVWFVYCTCSSFDKNPTWYNKDRNTARKSLFIRKSMYGMYLFSSFV